MKFFLWAFLVILVSCQTNTETRAPVRTANFQDRAAATLPDSTISGKSYLPVYSQIYQRSERLTFDLTITVSIRNMNADHDIYLKQVDYFDTKGQHIHNYLKKTIALSPYETVEIVVRGEDVQGGTGDNFIIDWAVPSGVHAPLIQGVMISTAGQQGLSFVTNAVQLQ